MKFVLWQQQLVRELGSDTWTLRFDREILIEGPSKEWCEAMHIGTVEVNSVCKVLSLNVMPYEEWRQTMDKWADSDLLAAGDAVNQMEEKGFVNYPCNTPTYWCDSFKQRVAAV